MFFKKCFLSTFFIASFLGITYAQPTLKYNLNFEDKNPSKILPEGWFKWGSYSLETDSATIYNGIYSTKIISDTEGNSFGSVAFEIPANYEGDSIQLSGFMKTLEVENGFAGLLLRVDGSSGGLAFDNMQDRNITGTNDWKQYQIVLPFPKESKQIYVAGILVGKGTAWFDDFTVKIDGVDLQIKTVNARSMYPADLDTEFSMGSNIQLPPKSNYSIKQLAFLCKIWGFLKYYHPEIGAGNMNWDFELFRILPAVLSAESEKSFNGVIYSWVKSLGDLQQCDSCIPTSESAFLKPDLEWINHSALDDKLRGLLINIYNNRFQGEHYYFGAAQVGNVDLRNENAYLSMPYPDTGYRLLTLFRYWNIIDYFFPYRHLIGRDWHKVLEEYIPKYVDAGSELEFEKVTSELISEINDTHAQLGAGADKLNAWKGVYNSNIRLDFIENKLVVTNYYNEELLESDDPNLGDIVTKINEIPVDHLVDSLMPYYSGSNKRSKLSYVARNLLRSNLPYIKIQYNSGEETNEKLLKLYETDTLKISEWYRGTGLPSYKMLDDKIGYITLQTISQKDISKIKEEFRDTKGIIIDIRNYPAYFVPFVLGSYFVSNPAPFAKFTKVNLNNPGEFTFSEPVAIPPDPTPYRGKLVVLVNNRSISQSEYTAMAFRAGDNTTIIGNTTAGADGNISRIVLPGNLNTIISAIGVYYPDGTETQRVGIAPDIEVWPTIQGIREGRDELLEMAIKTILN